MYHSEYSTRAQIWNYILEMEQCMNAICYLSEACVGKVDDYEMVADFLDGGQSIIEAMSVTGALFRRVLMTALEAPLTEKKGELESRWKEHSDNCNGYLHKFESYLKSEGLIPDTTH